MNVFNECVVLLLPIRFIILKESLSFRLLTRFAAKLNPLSDEDKTGGQ